MSSEKVRRVVCSRWKDEVEDGLGLPTHYPNLEFVKPDGLHCKLTIQEGADERRNISPPRFRSVGVVFCQIFQKPKVGESEVKTLADSIKSLFRAVTVEGVKFRTPSVKTMGSQGGWYQVNVSIPYQVDEVA